MFVREQVLIEKGVASPALEQMLKYCAPSATIEHLRSQEEFWNWQRTLQELKAGKYFPKGSKKEQPGDDEVDENGVVSP